MPGANRSTDGRSQTRPPGVVPLWKSGSSPRISIGRVAAIADVHGWVAFDVMGEDHPDEPTVLGLGVAPDVTSKAEAGHFDRKIQDGRRLNIPRELVEYKIGIDLEEYNDTDPFLFLPQYEEDSGFIALQPIGYESMIFANREDPNYPSPKRNETDLDPAADSYVPDWNQYRRDPTSKTATPEDRERADRLMEDVGIENDQRQIRWQALNPIRDNFSKTATDVSLNLLGVLLDDSPDLVDWGGLRTAIYYARPGALEEYLQELHFAEPVEAMALASYHADLGRALIARHLSVTNLPEDHPLNVGFEGPNDETIPVETVCIPAGPVPDSERSDELADTSAEGSPGGAQARTPAPFTDRQRRNLAGFAEVDVDHATHLLDTFTTDVSGGDLRRSDELVEGEDYHPVALEYRPPDRTVNYSEVTVAVVKRNAAARIALERLNLDDEPRVAQSIQEAHSSLAGTLLDSDSEAEVVSGRVTQAMRHFRQNGYDAIVLARDQTDALAADAEDS